MRLSDERKNIFKAMNLFRNQVEQPKKDAKNPFFKSTYVTLEGVTEAIDKATKGTGLSYMQNVLVAESGIGVQTFIMHESGEFIETDILEVPVSKKDAQAYGSAETYARRYSLSAAFGITSDLDDDGNSATANVPKGTTKQKNKPSKPVGASKDQLDKFKRGVEAFAELSGEETNIVQNEFLKAVGFKTGETITSDIANSAIKLLSESYKIQKEKNDKKDDLKNVLQEDLTPNE